MIERVIKWFRIDHFLVFLKKHSNTVSFLYTYAVLNKHVKNKIILVYTMGKVGSSSLSHHLLNNLEEYSVYHLHFLNRKKLRLDKKLHRKLYWKHKQTLSGTGFKTAPGYIQRGYYVRKHLKKWLNHKHELKICTLVRDPIERNISSFFENLKIFFGYDIKERLKKSDKNIVVEELIELFNRQYIQKNRKDFIDGDPITWFDEELKTVFNLDAYREPFPKEQGYSIIKKPGLSLLLIRMEDLDEKFPEASNAYFGRKMHLEKKVNTGKNKDYALVYESFKENIVLPSWYLDKYYQSQYATHFYTSDEIETFKNRWYER